MKRYDLIVIGAGPAGLSAAIEAASCGMQVMVFDENHRPGGQLFKQIHKFFGSKEHKAKTRGFRIGQELLERAREQGVTVMLDTVVMGLFECNGVSVLHDGQVLHVKGDSVIVATGAAENVVPFEGWTLPGVIGAGAAQTFMNLHRERPGQKILMVGSGNVGLVVSYQLLQAGCEVKALVDVLPRIGGYGVHAAKVARTGVPFYLSHTIVRAEGTDRVTGAVIAQVDGSFKPVPGTEKHFDVDTVCMAVGLSPMSQLTRMAGCVMTVKGGTVPKCDPCGATSVPGVYAAGDVAGIEEASSAMIQGRISALAAARRGEFIDGETFAERYEACRNALSKIRSGMFAPGNPKKMTMTETAEGYPLSLSLLQHGFQTVEELRKFPGRLDNRAGVHPVIECTQNIPCNPCQDACPRGCIAVGEDITNLPVLNPGKTCIGCGLCVAACPGQTIFLVKETEERAEITLPYEFLPLPEAGQTGTALDRSGAPLCEATVVGVKLLPVNDGTALLTMSVPAAMADSARFYQSREASR